MLMISSITKKILGFLTKQEVVTVNNKDEMEFIEYGIEITISSILNIVLVLIIGLLLQGFYESLIFLICFIPLRMYIGGYHAETYFNCNFIFSLAFACMLLLYFFTGQYMSIIPAIIINIFSILIVAVFGPVENKHKPITDEKKRQLKIVGILLTSIISAASILLIYNNVLQGALILYTLSLVIVFIIVAKLKEWRKI